MFPYPRCLVQILWIKVDIIEFVIEYDRSLAASRFLDLVVGVAASISAAPFKGNLVEGNHTCRHLCPNVTPEARSLGVLYNFNKPLRVASRRWLAALFAQPHPVKDDGHYYADDCSHGCHGHVLLPAVLSQERDH